MWSLGMALILSAGALAIEGEAHARSWQDEIVYVVVLQKFFNGDPSNDIMARRFGKDRERFEGGYWGGDLEGVRQKLDDLVDLGVTTLLLYPVVQNDRHPVGKFLPTGYRPRDDFQVDENLGDLAGLRRLVEEAHAKGLRIILDLPLGMPGFEHPYAADPKKVAWFGPPTPYGTRQWNTDNPDVAGYLISVAKFWKERSNCDGFRLDSAQVHPARFWKQFVRELKGEGRPEDFLILAELAVHPKEIGRLVQEAGFDGAYDFSAGVARDVFSKSEPVGKLAFVLREGKQFYDSPRSLMAQLDNYEDPAFVTVAREPKPARLRAALTFLLTLDRVPLIYSGDELALAYRDVGAAFPEGRRDSAFLQDVRRLIALRKAEPALRRGDWVEVEAKPPVCALLRVLGQERVLVGLNTASEAHEVRVSLGESRWRDCRLDDLIAGRSAKAAGDDAPITLGPFEGRVLKVH